MPSVLIETRCQRSALDEYEMMEAVHHSLVEAFKLPKHDRNIRLVAHEPHRFQCPPNKTEPDLYTVVNIDAFAGRSVAAKRNLYQSLANNLEGCGIPRDHVLIVLREHPTTNWGGGGRAASDVDLGFKVNV
jgi:phenylpyruvate tautomerase PptA (4-oxalocrotonate tautomerase family)